MVSDGPSDQARRIASQYPWCSYRQLEQPAGDFGGAARNFGLDIATGTHAVYMDDDDWFAPMAIQQIRDACRESFNELLIFRMDRPAAADTLWRVPVIAKGNISTQMIVHPIPTKARWHGHYEADFDFAVDLYEEIGSLSFRPEVIAVYGSKPGEHKHG